MKKLNKIITNEPFIVLILAIAIIANTIVLVINTRLETEIKAYKSYYKSSEALFNEIEDYNENLFDTDKAVDYYTAKNKLNAIK